MKSKLFEIAPGLALTIFVGFTAWWISNIFYPINSLVIGIIFGIMLKCFIGNRKNFLSGILFAQNIFFPLGIILYGTSLRFDKILTAIPIIGYQLVAGTIIVFISALYLGRKYISGDKIALLIAVGNSISGATALATTTQIVKSEPEDTAIAIILITILGFIGMLIYPLIPFWFGFSDSKYAMLCGITLPFSEMTRTAVEYFGKDIIDLTLAVEKVRAVIIIPVIVFLFWFKSERKGKSIIKEVPWFIWIFILAGAVFSFVPVMGSFSWPLITYSGLFFTIAMTGTGLTCEIEKMINSGGAPIIIAVVSWILLTITFLTGLIL